MQTPLDGTAPRPFQQALPFTICGWVVDDVVQLGVGVEVLLTRVRVGGVQVGGSRCTWPSCGPRRAPPTRGSGWPGPCRRPVEVLAVPRAVQVPEHIVQGTVLKQHHHDVIRACDLSSAAINHASSPCQPRPGRPGQQHRRHRRVHAAHRPSPSGGRLGLWAAQDAPGPPPPPRGRSPGPCPAAGNCSRSIYAAAPSVRVERRLGTTATVPRLPYARGRGHRGPSFRRNAAAASRAPRRATPRCSRPAPGRAAAAVPAG